MRSLKFSLIVLTLVSVIADSMLLPFYPQFFAQAFDNHSTQLVGYYIAASCLTVIVSFPVWAKIAKRVNELHLWVGTQIIAAALGLACYYSSSLLQFWLLSQLMLMFKASYLLIYPFVIRLEEKDKHMNMVSLFSVLMHFGAIGGALLGGVILQMFSAKDAYLVMPISDAIQVVVCLFIIAKLRVPFWAEIPSVETSSFISPEHKKFIANLGIVSMLFYFSVFLITPFFSRYWELISDFNSEIISGVVYSIPGWIALIGLWVNSRAQASENHKLHIVSAMLIGIVGLIIQGAPQEWLVIVGRGVFGWGLFQVTVRLEVFLFANSAPENYARDFSRLYLFQNIGVIAASFVAGYIVQSHPLASLFFVAAFGLSSSLIYFVMAFKDKFRITSTGIPEAQ